MCPLSMQCPLKRIGSLQALLARLRPGRVSSQAPGGRPWFRPGVEQFEDRFLPAVSLLQNFANINSNQTAVDTPPDTTMAVGPTAVIGAVDTAITLTDKTGNGRVGPTDFSSFFAAVSTAGDTFREPSIVYDDQANRFYIAIVEITSGFTTSQIDFAVSKGTAPATLGSGDWSVYAITEVNEGGTAFPDFPQMGWNNDAVFISTNQTNTASSHDHILALTKASLFTGGPLTLNSSNVPIGSARNILIPARMHNEVTGDLEYFVQSQGAVTSTMVSVVQETGYLSGPGSFTSTPLTVNSYNNSPGVAGLTGQIDDRILSADWVDNGTTQHLVAAGNVGENGINLARWYEFNAPTSGAPTLLQQGDINLGPAIATSYPSIALNPSDNIAITFLENGNGQATSMYVTGRQATDPMGALETPILVKAGVLPATAMNRGGDYSATEYDPATPGNFWSANQFQLAASGSNLDWGTQIAAYTFVPGPVLTPGANQSASEGSARSFNLGSFSDPGTGPWSVTVNWGDGSMNNTSSAMSAG
ncbi:MAG TPA: hypothetical protein VKU02_18395, partial [Gemmataceae bacterium]|nr:hypothetical protein [Gemmataceae bacterium]